LREKQEAEAAAEGDASGARESKTADDPKQAGVVDVPAETEQANSS
jgi:hypothetical protein